MQGLAKDAIGTGTGKAGNLAGIVLEAQRQAALRLGDAIEEGRFNRPRYQDWLLAESVACRLAALALDTVADWQPPRQARRRAALDWAAELRDWAGQAMSDIRMQEGFALAPPPVLARWRDFIAEVGGSQRVGEALGTVQLHVCRLDGPARDALAVLATMPCALHADGYLQQRLQAASQPLPADRADLLADYANAALAAGARRATGWWQACLEQLFAHPSAMGA